MTTGSRGPVIAPAPRRGEVLATLDGLRVTVGEPIGQGGQGGVYALEGDPHRCVKVYFETDEARAERLRKRFEALRKAQATDALVLPQAVLQAPATGYVMERVRDVRPIRALAVAPRGVDVTRWYAEGGGLRRRLLLAAELAHAFQQLHQRGLAYCDLSWDNVLVPERGPPAVRLIDCDNLTVDLAPAPTVLGTDWFMAPEVVSRRGAPRTESDQHALAVLIYHLLVLTHPLLGDAIREAEPEAERNAAAGRWLDGGRLPWIDHPDDARNRTRTGLPRAVVLSRLLQSTFHDAFCDGLLQPARRPTEARWLDVLGRALDGTITCHRCRHTFYLTEKACPWCDVARAPAWVLLCQHHASEKRPVAVEQRRRLFPRHLHSRPPQVGEAPLVTATVDGAGLAIEVTGEEQLTFRRKGGALETLNPGQTVGLRAGDGFRATSSRVWVEVKQG